MSLNRPVLLIDQDDVLAEYISAVVEAFNNKYGTRFKTSDCTAWDLASIFGEEILTVMHEPELFRNLKPVKDAVETFERLYRSNLFEMYIVTAAHPRTVEAKYDWIKEHMAFLPQKNIIVSSAKHMIKGDYLLDDGMHNIKAFADTDGTPIVFDRPHNQLEGKGFRRVGNWLDFEKLIINECYADLSPAYFKEHLSNKQAI